MIGVDSMRQRGADAIFEAFNVDNHVNFNNPVGNLATGSCGRPDPARHARQLHLDPRFGF